MAAVASATLAQTVKAQDSVELTGYSKGNVLSKIDGLDVLNLWGEQPAPVQKLIRLLILFSRKTRSSPVPINTSPSNYRAL